jgi:TonB-linked SusC/RagA family outer membrane protein
MTKRAVTLLVGILLVAAPRAFAQQKTITGKVASEQGMPLPGVSIAIKGTIISTSSNNDGNYSIRVAVGQVLQFRLIGTAPLERTVGAEDVINVELRKVALNLDAVVVTALGQTTTQRALGYSQQTVQGPEIAQTQRENFVNALGGRVAGVDVTSTSGVPGASSSIIIRGVSSISSSNQPLIIVDGLPMDNRTLNTAVLASELSSNTAFSNRGVDFTNRAADLNPEDIETLTVLKGAEASALYGIDAANGAILITTKRGKAGGGWQYSNSVRIEATRAKPELQRVYGPSTLIGGNLASFIYFGAPYPAGTRFYDNIGAFLRTGRTQTHNLSFSGASPDNTVNYRLATSIDNQSGVVANSGYDRVNVTGASQAQIKPWLSTDLSMAYTYSNNDQVYKGEIGPLIGLMLWPQNDNAQDYLTPSGLRRRLTSLTAAGEVDNPYFNVAKNAINSKESRLVANVGIVVAPVSWGSLKSNIGTDTYTNQNLLLRNPESEAGNASGGILDQADVITRNINAQTLLNFNRHALTNSISISGLLGNAIGDFRSTADAAVGTNFLDPNFVSMNNTGSRLPRTTTERRRLVSFFGQAVLDYRNFLFLTLQGRNDRTSTIPPPRHSFFYPGISTSFVFSDAFPGIARFVTGKLRAAYAQAGKDARPYSYVPSLEFKSTSFGGYGYGFTGPNPGLKPEFASSYELGAELSFLHDRLGLDATVYRKQTRDQIVNDIRGSYGTGYILFNLNGATTRNEGLELTLRGTPVVKSTFSWDFQVNVTSERGKVLSLPRGIPESYVSDTWLWGNVRNGTAPGLSTMSLTGLFYLRVQTDSAGRKGQLLIDPTTGLPIRSATFIDAGYDRQPDFTIGVSNTVTYKHFSLDFLLDIRKGGDVFNATEHYLATHGLSMQTLDREQPRVVQGVLQDGKENSSNPTINNIVVIPSVQSAYYTNMSEELFIEKNINWLRLRDVQLSYRLPEGFLGTRNASVFVKGTDLFLITNYTGLDPIVNGNSAAVGGSGGVGIDFGNFPMPVGVNVGVRMGF